MNSKIPSFPKCRKCAHVKKKRNSCAIDTSWNTIHICSFTHTTAVVHWRSSNNNDFRLAGRLSYSLRFSIPLPANCEQYHTSPPLCSFVSIGADARPALPRSRSLRFSSLRGLISSWVAGFTASRRIYVSKMASFLAAHHGNSKGDQVRDNPEVFQGTNIISQISSFLVLEDAISSVCRGKRSPSYHANLTQNGSKTSWGIKGPVFFPLEKITFFTIDFCTWYLLTVVLTLIVRDAGTHAILEPVQSAFRSFPPVSSV